MHRFVYALLLLAWPAHADCVQWGHDPHGNSACLVDRNVAESGHSGSSFSTYVLPNNVVTTSPTARLGCADDEERVMRQDFSIGCAKDVRPQEWR
jgi:hypothetical protein